MWKITSDGEKAAPNNLLIETRYRNINRHWRRLTKEKILSKYVFFLHFLSFFLTHFWSKDNCIYSFFSISLKIEAIPKHLRVVTNVPHFRTFPHFRRRYLYLWDLPAAQARRGTEIYNFPPSIHGNLLIYNFTNHFQFQGI